MARVKKIKKFKELEKNTFQAEGTIDTFGSKVEESPHLAKGAMAQELSTQAKLEDPGEGKPIILRTFQFALPPGIPAGMIPSNQQMLEWHLPKIKNVLWADELDIVSEPKLVFKQGKFMIFVPCQPKKGNILPWYNNNPLPIQEAISNGRQRHS